MALRLIFAGKVRPPARKEWSLYLQDLTGLMDEPRTARPTARAEA